MFGILLVDDEQARGVLSELVRFLPDFNERLCLLQLHFSDNTGNLCRVRRSGIHNDWHNRLTDRLTT